MRALVFSSALASLGAARAFGQAACALDPGPAATLLLPYFDVDLDHPDGRTTLFSIVNSAAEAVLTRVTLWTDLGIPTLTFHVYLTGYDVETINLRDAFDGRLPRTASHGQDPGDQISPHGDYSQDIDFGNCAGFLPPAALSAQAVLDLRAEHRGFASSRLDGKCASVFKGDNRVRGYVTVDTVSNCSARTPRDAGYFSSPSGPGDATAQNVLWGDYFYVEPGQNFASGDALVRIQAFPGRFTTGQRTFYGWLQNGSTADQREPLALTWSSRYLTGGAFDGGSDLIFWQDATVPYAPFICPGPPLPDAQRNVEIVLFDEQETSFAFGCFPIPAPCTPNAYFPWIANRVVVDGPSLPTVEDAGVLVAYPKYGLPRQSWMGVVMKASGRFSVGFAGTPLDSACGSPTCPPGSTCTP